MDARVVAIQVDVGRSQRLRGDALPGHGSLLIETPQQGEACRSRLLLVGGGPFDVEHQGLHLGEELLHQRLPALQVGGDDARRVADAIGVLGAPAAGGPCASRTPGRLPRGGPRGR